MPKLWSKSEAILENQWKSDIYELSECNELLEFSAKLNHRSSLTKQNKKWRKL